MQRSREWSVGCQRLGRGVGRGESLVSGHRVTVDGRNESYHATS
jgi:hypothetical protein